MDTDEIKTQAQFSFYNNELSAVTEHIFITSFFGKVYLSYKKYS